MENVDFLKQLNQENFEGGLLHIFPNMEDSERLCYEKLGSTNFSILVDLFSNDASQFINKRFKTIESANKYSKEILNSLYSAKYGGCDFF